VNTGLSDSTTPTTTTTGLTITDVYVSDTGAKIAGPLTSAPSLPIDSSSYTWGNAQIISTLPDSWTSISGANWISTTSANSGVETNNEGDTWRLFKTTFTVPPNATTLQATVYIAADNAFEFYLNGTRITTTADFSPSAPVYGPPGSNTAPFTNTWSYDIAPTTGSNTLLFVVRNWYHEDSANPSGLVYKVSVVYHN
jgi:hypothetical protein